MRQRRVERAAGVVLAGVVLAGCATSPATPLVGLPTTTYPAVLRYPIGRVGPVLEGQVEAITVSRNVVSAVVRWTNIPQSASLLRWARGSLTSTRPLVQYVAAVNVNGHLWWARRQASSLVVSDGTVRRTVELPAGASPVPQLMVVPSGAGGAIVLRTPTGEGVQSWGDLGMVWSPLPAGQPGPVAMGPGRTLWAAVARPDHLLVRAGARWRQWPLPGPVLTMWPGRRGMWVLINTVSNVQSGIGTSIMEFSASGQRLRQIAVPEPSTTGPGSITPWYGGATNILSSGPRQAVAVLWDPASQQIALEGIDLGTGRGQLWPRAILSANLAPGQRPNFPLRQVDGMTVIGNGNGLAFYVPSTTVWSRVHNIMN